MGWTKEQMKCIDPKNGVHNILVSAGAGAGKTATLVEKIIKSITNSKQDTGINEILCVTFTRDAAREMKERIVEAVESMIRKHPNDIWLKKQLALTETASIMTIDSFCLRLIKDHISETDIDPAFRIADMAELSMLTEKTMERFLEEKYKKAEENFISFADAYATGKHDRGIRESILSVYTMAQSNPFPKEWIASCRDILWCDDAEQAGWMVFLMQDIVLQLSSIFQNLNSLLEVCREPDGPYVYEPMIASDISQIEALLACTTYKSMSTRLAGIEFTRMTTKKDPKINLSKREFVSNARNSLKKSLQDIQKKFSLKNVDFSTLMGEIRPHMLTLLELTEDFSDAYDIAKKEKNILDFNDVEHAALKLLVDEETKKYTELANGVAGTFKQIYVDEYQDVNILQETIIKSISGERFGKPNVFMVGDVKQSIYKFRLARPELFLEKYASYSEDDMALNQKVELQLNFRSRKEVLDTVNFFFSQLMTKNLGNICYDSKTALNHAASYPLGVKAKKTSLHLIDTADSPLDDVKGVQKEAMVIADIIKSIVGKEAVYDKKTGAYRPATYKDIVILTRTFSGWAEDIRDILDQEGVPSYADKTEGFFDTVEVRSVLSVLQVADNPMQDIPLSSAMMQVWGFNAIEMSDIVNSFKKVPENKGNLYSCIKSYAINGEDDFLKEKVDSFLRFLEKINIECKDYSIYELLNMIYSETGYYSKMISMPTGEIKKANLEMLLIEAEKFAKTDSSAGGMFQFVRYVDTLQKYEKESAESAYMDKDATRITTIHKSKGLEFPVVILAGIGKNFNQQDIRKPVLVHQEMGIVSDCIDTTKRTKKMTLPKKAVARKIQIETMEEELRILYVAMTRAKERLVMVGADKNIIGKINKYAMLSNQTDASLPYMELTKASSFLDWILMALSRNKIFESYYRMQGLEMNKANQIYNMESNVEVIMVDTQNLIMNHSTEEKLMKVKINDILDIIEGKSNIKSNEPYNFKAVSELKPKALPEELLNTKKGRRNKKKAIKTVAEKKSSLMPKFMKKETITGADKGNVYHRLLQVLDFSKCETVNGLEEEFERLVNEAVFTKKQLSIIKKELIVGLFETDIGKRMIKAYKMEEFKREVYYMESVPGTLVDPMVEDDTTVIIQGVIDAYFKEEDGFVLVDYKSERVQPGKESGAVKKHISQIERYRSVMTKNGLPVKEAYVIFLQTGKAVAI